MLKLAICDEQRPPAQSSVLSQTRPLLNLVVLRTDIVLFFDSVDIREQTS